MYNSLTDEEMIRLLLPNEPSQCFETLYNRYMSKVYRQCLSVIQDSEKAQDFTHDIFLKVFDKLNAFQQRSSFSTWLYSIAYNYCADQLRLARRLPITTLDNTVKQDIPESQEAHLHEETLQRISRAMARLTDDERAILKMKYEGGMSIDEIAGLYHTNISAMKMRLKRSREKVQRLCV